MKSLAKRIGEKNMFLAPYAVPTQGIAGREHEEEHPDETRFPFQRDRDRIIHCTAFRRLKGKTQVFVYGIGDHYRTRLTHTMEAAQIGRDMARTLELNEDRAECVALAHDLGHPPFGHAGEDALDLWMRRHGSRFEHNAQSYRIVSLLERRSSHHMGLNLNLEVLEGLKKHTTPFDNAVCGDTSASGACLKLPLEAQVVNIADEIAYTGHDFDDGLRAGLFRIEDILKISLVNEARKRSEAAGTQLRGALVHMLVMDVYSETEIQIASRKISSLEDVYAQQGHAVRFSEAMRSRLDELRAFLWDNMYMHPQVLEKTEEGKTTVTLLCDRFLSSPPKKVLELNSVYGGEMYESIKDYVAGMTDEYARRMNNE